MRSWLIGLALTSRSLSIFWYLVSRATHCGLITAALAGLGNSAHNTITPTIERTILETIFISPCGCVGCVGFAFQAVAGIENKAVVLILKLRSFAFNNGVEIANRALAGLGFGGGFGFLLGIKFSLRGKLV